jgi:hypothetical protein
MFGKEDVSKSVCGQIRETIHDVAKSLAADTDGKYQASASAVREQALRLAELAKKLEEYEHHSPS